MIKLICINYVIWTNWRSSILFGIFNLETCNVCKNLMKGSQKISTNVKVIKNVKRLNCQIVVITFFITFQNNRVNYANLPNHDNLSMIWKYYLNLVYFVFDKILKFYHVGFLFIFTPNQNLSLFRWKILTTLKKIKNICWKILRFMK